MDMTLKYDYKGLYLWAVYSHGYVTRNDGLDEYVPHFDRRHNLNLVMNYLFGERKDWEFDARWNLGSGFSFTQTQGAYGLITFEEGIDTDYTTTNESFEIYLWRIQRCAPLILSPPGPWIEKDIFPQRILPAGCEPQRNECL
ncbi:MAG: hypothetical protein U5L09_04465 [Bacteroidales bacterium]|nr:hypothetical protein [Bacteroidales bacterium]